MCKWSPKQNQFILHGRVCFFRAEERARQWVWKEGKEATARSYSAGEVCQKYCQEEGSHGRPCAEQGRESAACHIKQELQRVISMKKLLCSVWSWVFGGNWTENLEIPKYRLSSFLNFAEFKPQVRNQWTKENHRPVAVWVFFYLPWWLIHLHADSVTLLAWGLYDSVICVCVCVCVCVCDMMPVYIGQPSHLSIFLSFTR